jgi:serine/threonine protein kinase
MNNYTIIKNIGKGKFGTVYMAKHKKTMEIVAIKCESSENPYKSIKHEATILNYLYRCSCRCIPRVLYYGIHENNVCLIMKYFDVSWEDYMKNGKIDSKRLKRIMICGIDILKSIHKHKILHRDIKPANFMMRDNQLFLIDFGMATSFTEGFCENPSKQHIVGSPKYASYFIHCGYDSRIRDDMISFGYCYMSFLKTLPWCVENMQHIDYIPYTHIEHPDNMYRKNEKSIEKIRQDIDSYLLKYFEHCYSAKNNVDCEYLSSLFL